MSFFKSLLLSCFVLYFCVISSYAEEMIDFIYYPEQPACVLSTLSKSFGDDEVLLQLGIQKDELNHKTRSSLDAFVPSEGSYRINGRNNSFDDFYRGGCRKRGRWDSQRKSVTTNNYINAEGKESCSEPASAGGVCTQDKNGNNVFYNTKCAAHSLGVKKAYNDYVSSITLTTSKVVCNGKEISPKNIICEDTYGPVCGTDNRTYNNFCELTKVQMLGGAGFAHAGTCNYPLQQNIIVGLTDGSRYQYLPESPHGYFSMNQLYTDVSNQNKQTMRDLYKNLHEKISQDFGGAKGIVIEKKIVQMLEGKMSINRARRLSQRDDLQFIPHQQERQLMFLKDLFARNGDESNTPFKKGTE